MTPRKLFFVMLVALILTFALTATGIYFADKYLGERSKTISSLRADDELMSTELINAQGTRKSLKEYGYLDEVTSNILPDAKNQSEVILLIDEISSEVGISVAKFNFLTTDGLPSEKSQTKAFEGTNNILVFPVEIEFNSSYDQLITWLKLAEKNQRKMQVSDINITDSKTTEGLTTVMTINAYLEK